MKKIVLVVDDSRINRRILEKTLSMTYDVIQAENGREAIEMLESSPRPVDAVLLDVLMPVMDGFEFLAWVRETRRYIDLPIVVMTGDSGNNTEIRALSLGAWDFVSKPYDPTILFFRLKNAIARSELSAFEQIKRMAEFDEITGIYNRNKLYEEARLLIKSNPDTSYVFVRFDIDSFKVYNEIFGIKKGNALLSSIGVLMSARLSHKLIAFGHIEADHFAAVLPAAEFDPEAWTSVAMEWLDAYKSDFKFTPRFGICVIDNAELDMNLISDRALLALRSLKQSYSRFYAYYDDSLRMAMLEEQEILREMDDALANGEFDIFLQPQYNHTQNALIGAEALVRWFHPTKGRIPPYKFIPVFEKNGFISTLDEYVWERACAVTRKWLDEGLDVVPISVNISRVDMYNRRLLGILTGLMEKYALDPKLLHLEITETAYMENPSQLIEIVEHMREFGFLIEMDDFGSGYSSLNSLKEVPVDLIKLDLKFLSSSDPNGRGSIILSSVVRMARELGLPIIAEGVETAGQADFLKTIGCELMQGYLYAKPMPVSEFESFLSKKA